MKPRILFLITSDEYIRNYIDTGVLADVEKENDFFYAASSNLKNKNYFKDYTNFVGSYKSNGFQDAKLIDLFDVYMYMNINKSPSFKFRFLRYGLPKKKSFKKTIYHFVTNALKLNLDFFAHYFKQEIIRFRASGLIRKYYINSVQKSLTVNEDLHEIIKANKPDLVVFPSSAYDPISYDLLELSKIYNFKTYSVIDNWDNLSSKTILIDKPDYIGVWSEQGKKHAIEIQDMQLEKIKILGSARFAQYFEQRDHQLKPHFDFKYILFIGTAIVFDEIGALDILDDVFSNNSDLKDIKIIYRPHPWRQSRDSIEHKNFKNVIIDPQIEENYLKKDFTSNNQPDLNYYPSLLLNAEFIVGGLSSMVIETLIFRKPFLGLVYDDGKNFTNQKNALNCYAHFEGIENLSGLEMCHEKSDLEKCVFEIWDKRSSYDMKKIDDSLEYYLYSNQDIPFRKKLAESVLEIMEDINNPNPNI